MRLVVLKELAEYVLSEIESNYDDPFWWQQRFKSRIVGPLLGEIHRTKNGVAVLDEDWDNLFILDACRADMFKETIDLNEFDSYRQVISAGASSPEWMRENFLGREMGDTVYITANPWISKIAPDSFHEIVNIWFREYEVEQDDLANATSLGDIEKNLDQPNLPEGITTITAHKVNEVVREVSEIYDDKRIIVHYFQPHAPCIGNSEGCLKSPESIDSRVVPGPPLKSGEITREEVWGAYQDNLRYAYHHAIELAEELGGKTVVSSDHGELFGEYLWPFPVRGYGHPSGLRHPNLMTVPWAVLNGERRKIIDDGTSFEQQDMEEVNQRLRDLGYKV